MAYGGLKCFESIMSGSDKAKQSWKSKAFCYAPTPQPLLVEGTAGVNSLPYFASQFDFSFARKSGIDSVKLSLRDQKFENLTDFESGRLREASDKLVADIKSGEDFRLNHN